MKMEPLVLHGEIRGWGRVPHTFAVFANVWKRDVGVYVPHHNLTVDGE